MPPDDSAAQGSTAAGNDTTDVPELPQAIIAQAEAAASSNADDQPVSPPPADTDSPPPHHSYASMPVVSCKLVAYEGNQFADQVIGIPKTRSRPALRMTTSNAPSKSSPRQLSVQSSVRLISIKMALTPEQRSQVRRLLLFCTKRRVDRDQVTDVSISTSIKERGGCRICS